MYAYISLHCSSMDPLDSVQSPGNGQISDGLDEGELLENLRNAPIFSPQRSPRFLDVCYLQPSPDFFGWQFGFDTSLPPFPTDSVSPLHDLFTSSRVYVSLSSSTENVHQAALRLQKVYKSFRTRRRLADCAVVVEKIWSKKLDFAELMLSFISFFGIERRETAVSRWPRARTRVAKVGISKDQRARKIWLEAIDPRHRFGHNLHFYYDTWFDSKSKQPFFYWLDIGEGKEVNLERCPRFKLRQQCIKYLGPTERKAYEVAVQDGKFFYKQSGKLLDTRGWSQDAKWIFVLSTSKTLYVGQKHRGTFQHSSFLAGGATLSAGRLVVEDGILKAVWPHSGHYLPTEENFENFILFLEEHNVDLSIVQEWRQQLNRCSLEEERSVEIIIPSMDKKLDSRQLDQNNRYMWDLMFQKSGYKPFSGDMSCASICHSHMKNAMGTPERKCGTKREITIKDLQPLIGQKRADAAKILGVSVSTFKRHCRSNGIKWWNGGECSRAFELDPKHRERPGEKTTRSCKTPSITGQTETGNQVEVAVSEGDSKSSWPMLPCFDRASKQSVVTIKATYREDIIKFDLSLTSGIVELKEEVAKRLELESDSFKVKYQDEDQEWILIACDADFQGCLEFSSSLGNQSVRILVVDKVFNFGKS